MKYDFDTRIDRVASGCLKWNQWKGKLPMWVADMDFRSPPPILEALTTRVDHGFFGYEDAEPPKDSPTAIGARLKRTIIGWLKKRYDWEIDQEHILFLPGLVSGLNLACRAFGTVGDGVLMLTPVYPPFRRAPRNNGLFAHEIPLARQDTDDYIHYVIDFDALNAAVKRKRKARARMLMLSHPHNPIGHEFTEAEHKRLRDFCIQHDLVVCSDEIHCDLRLDKAKHKPNGTFPDMAERTVTLMSPSKTFNLSGLGLGFAVVTNPSLRERLENAAEDVVPHLSPLAATAALTAYSGACDEWLEQLLVYLTKNRDELLATVKTKMPGVKATMPTATYLCWLLCTDPRFGGNPFKFFLKHAGVATSPGYEFGGDGQEFIRFNFGCPRSQMQEALEAMAVALERG